MARKKAKGTELSVFKGREAKLNRAIFKILITKGSQTAYDIHRQLALQKRLRHTRYSTVNKRVHILLERGYIKKEKLRETKAGFRAQMYSITTKANLAILINSIDMDKFVNYINDENAQVILLLVIDAYFKENNNITQN